MARTFSLHTGHSSTVVTKVQLVLPGPVPTHASRHLTTTSGSDGFRESADLENEASRFDEAMVFVPLRQWDDRVDTEGKVK